jgi:hypothetical protein
VRGVSPSVLPPPLLSAIAGHSEFQSRAMRVVMNTDPLVSTSLPMRAI